VILSELRTYLQRKLYLQLYQQIKRRYQLLIDLHSGLDENGPCADI